MMRVRMPSIMTRVGSNFKQVHNSPKVGRIIQLLGFFFGIIMSINRKGCIEWKAMQFTVDSLRAKARVI